MRFRPGDEILVFYDAKLCRGTVGTVVSVGRYGWATKKRHSQITVRFVPFHSEDGVEIVATFRPSHRGRRGRTSPPTTARCVGIIGAVESWRSYFGLDWELWYGSWTQHGYHYARPRESVDPWYWPENMLARKIKQESRPCSSASQ